MHEAAYGEMKHEETVKLLPYQVWRLTAKQDLGPAQVHLQFIDRVFHFPALLIQGR
jgi:hypothetical protein